MKKNNGSRILIWDLPLRLFHWGLVAAIFWSWLSVEILEDMQQHFWAGYTVLTLLIFRVIWGFVGSFYSRFKTLLFRPVEIVAYIKAFSSPKPLTYPGHNPLGSIAVLAMLLVLIAQVSTGLFSSDEYFYGPLAGLVDSATITQFTDLHHRNFQLIQIVIGVHIVAIVLYRVIKKERLTKAMITGDKDPNAITEASHALGSNKVWTAVIVLLISLAAVYLIVNHVADPVEFTDSYY